MWIQGGDHRFPDYELDGGSLTPDEVRRVIGMSAHHLRHRKTFCVSMQDEGTSP